MAEIRWSVGDFFFCSSSRGLGAGMDTYGVVTSAKKGECVIVRDSGLRTGRFTIVPMLIPLNAMPSELKCAGFSVKMALCAVAVALRRSGEVRVV